ncbi:hypothetical protein ACOSQ2_012326 [Xanthoceras sorbifolium]
MVVWLAAERVYPGSGKFKAYATLGDDVVIADSRVAKEYQEASALGGNSCRDFGFEFCGHNAEVTSLDFHPVKKEILCSCDALGTIKLWNVNDQTCTGTFKYNEVVSSFCWNKDGSQIVSISTNGVRVWSADDGKYFLVRSKNAEMFYSCMFHPIYSQIVILGSDKFLELWNTTNDLSWTVRAHDGFISSLAGSVTTKMVAKARLDQCVKLWTLEPYQDESEFIGPESVKYKAVPTEKYFWNHQTV